MKLETPHIAFINMAACPKHVLSTAVNETHLKISMESMINSCKVYPNIIGKQTLSLIKLAKFLLFVFKILNHSCVSMSITFSLYISLTICMYQGLKKDSHAYSASQKYILTQTNRVMYKSVNCITTYKSKK